MVKQINITFSQAELELAANIWHDLAQNQARYPNTPQGVRRLFVDGLRKTFSEVLDRRDWQFLNQNQAANMPE